MILNEFLWHAKRGHGECILEMQQGNISKYKKIVKKVFLNNYAFLYEEEYRSAYTCELVRFYNDDKHFLNLLWNKIKKTKLEYYYTFDYLINNLFFILKRNVDCNYKNEIEHLLIKNLKRNFFTKNENSSICSLISLVFDLKLNISIKKIVDQHYATNKNSNLDLSYIEYCYHISLSSKDNNFLLLDHDKINNFDALLECISHNDTFNKQLPFIVNNISNKNFETLLDLLVDKKIDTSSKTNILRLVFYSRKKDIKTINKILDAMNNFTQKKKNIVYDILVKLKSKKVLSLLKQNNFDNSFIIRLQLNDYNNNKYEELHNRILKLKINYNNSSNWFEVENDLIKYCNRKKIDERLLTDVKYFFKNGLSSYSRYKIAIILSKYHMLDTREIECLKFDANYKIRQKFKNL